MTDRYLLLGLARAREPWFTQVSRWASSALLGAEFVKCLSAGELAARLDSSPLISAVLLDAAAPGVDRDLIASARAQGAVVALVDDPRVERNWTELGAHFVLPRDFDAQLLKTRLVESDAPVAAAHLGPIASMPGPTPEPPVVFDATVIGVCGVAGSGVSTLAAALAQGFAGRPDGRGSVLLADLALRSDQAAYHDVGDVIPGVQELVEAHRTGRPTRASVRSSTFDIEPRGYDLLIGIRRPRDWVALATRATDAMLHTLGTSYRYVVADLTAEFDGEDETGSIDIEERNHLARNVALRSDAVVVVSTPDLRGVRGLVRIVDELLGLGVAPARILPVLNRAPRSRRSRAELTRTVATLVDARVLTPTLLIGDRRNMESLHRAVDPFPDSVSAALANATLAVAS